MAPHHASPAIDGAQIRTLRQATGINASALARRVGISPQYMTQIERGHRPTVSPSVCNRLAAALGVDRTALLRPATQDAA